MFRLILFFTLVLQFSFAFSAPLSRNNVPEPLKPWLEWVLHDETSYQCPFLYNNFHHKQCQWPGKLNLNLQSTQAQFSSQWQVYNESWVTLPGDKNYWPQQVTINSKPALVLSRQGKPSIKLTAGSYLIKGEFSWDKIPENLTIPADTGIIQLKIKGKTVLYPTIKKNRVWLKESDIGEKKAKNVENKVELQVFRKVDDNVPLQLTTVFELNISGDQREITLPHALLSDFIPISLKSPLPARIEPNGNLLIQVRPGQWHIELSARHPELLAELMLNIDDKQWPKTEIWSFNAQSFLRVVEINNLKSIDPSQTNIPKQWKNLPAYQLKQGETMAFKQIRRGDPEPEPNQLKLFRTLWLDFDGDGYTVADLISGKMTKGWRLDALSETEVGQVKLNGQNQLITRSTKTDNKGVEVRKGTIDLHADSRIKGDISQISAVGWDQDFSEVSTALNIPPGWRLLAASGVDNVPNSWVSQWTLLDLFLVLIAALAISRLWNVYWGLFALISIGLCWHESQSPHFIWLNIIATIALIRVLPESNFKIALKWYRNVSWLFLIVIVIPFMVSQIRIGLYPQLEAPWKRISSPVRPALPRDLVSAKPKFVNESSLDESYSVMKSLASGSANALIQSRLKPIVYERVDPDANIQTGPGLPHWQWSKIYLSWNGAVDSQQQLSLWYLSPTLTMLLNFIRVFLVSVLSLLMFGVLDKSFKFPKALLSWALLIPFLTLPVQDVYADFPDQKMLEELNNRLLQAPDCLPVCAQISSMQLLIEPNDIRVKLEVHSQEPVAIPLPAKVGQWMPNEVWVDGHQVGTLIRKYDLLWVGIDQGRHIIELKGGGRFRNKFSLPLTLKPHYVSIESKGWIVEGVHPNGQADKQLLFNRVKTAQQQANAKTLEAGVLPAFIRIERTLKLGLDWRIKTRIIRMATNDSAIVLNLPLLKNESVTTEKIRVKDNHVLVNMSARQNTLQWESTLKKSSEIELTAANTASWNEVWRADISPMWHLQATGISVVHHQDNGRWLPEWRPWPGEKVLLTISRPEAVQGSTLTIDGTELIVKPGKRTLETELRVSIRSSKGTQHTITLPELAELQTVKINGVTQPIRQSQSQVTIPIKPGNQELALVWRNRQEQTLVLKTPVVNLGADNVNYQLIIRMGQDRWVLFAKGPSFGPAILFWGMLIVIAILSFGLGNIPLTPLNYWQWFLLLIGLSQIPVAYAICVVIWLIALGYRAKHSKLESAYFNFKQIGLGFLTFASLLILFVAVQHGLLGSPDMQISGNFSSAFHLNWYQDRSSELLPTATIISIPMMAYRILMLLWSLWLAVSLLNWLKWGWNCFAMDGLWKESKKVEKKEVMDNDK